MADPFALEKISIDELDPLPGTVDPSEVYLPVFHRSTSTTPLQTTLDQVGVTGGTLHKEAKKFQISSIIINELFATDGSNFLETPVNTKSIEVYKYVDGYKYNYIIQNLNVSTTGITGTVIDVDPSVIITDFTGIILEYCLFERSA